MKREDREARNKEMLATYETGGISYRALAERYGMTLMGAWRAVYRGKFPLESKATVRACPKCETPLAQYSYGTTCRRCATRKPHDEQLRQRAAKLWSQGLSTATIGERLGVTKNSIVGFASRDRQSFPARPSPIAR